MKGLSALPMAAMVLLALGWGSSAFAYSSYLNDFNNLYGTSGSRLDTCGTCHYDFNGGGSLNKYGSQAANHGLDFASIESLDADGDGSTNLDEIDVLFMAGLDCTSVNSTRSAPSNIEDYVDPGDPGCVGGTIDEDGDGYTSDVDCDDGDPEVNPGATEDCTDGIDNDCDGWTDDQDPDCGAPGCLTQGTAPGSTGRFGFIPLLLLPIVGFGLKRSRAQERAE